MIRRAGRGDVLVKCCKPQQDRRVDLPTIGLRTIENAHAAGLKGIALDAGASLIVDRADVIRRADELGLFVVGIENPSLISHEGMRDTLHVCLIAGEESGDHLGASVMKALKAKHPQVRFSGVGGAGMQAEGLESLFPMEELSLMGITEILPHVPNLLSRIKQTSKTILRTKPDVCLTIDAPGFCFRVLKRIRAIEASQNIEKNEAINCIHYVAPSVWAWKPGRAEKSAKLLNHMLCLLPFEPPYFEKYGLPATCVGHQVVEKKPGDGAAFRARHGIAPDVPILCILPGSRNVELKKLLRRFIKAAKVVREKYPDTVVVIPTLPHLQASIASELRAAEFQTMGLQALITANPHDKFDCFAAANVALASSGTVTLELALNGTPHIVAYRLSTMTAWLARKLIKTPFVNLINITIGRRVIPEMLQENCTARLLADEILKLMGSDDLYQEQQNAFQQTLKSMGLGDTKTPGEKAADVILQ